MQERSTALAKVRDDHWGIGITRLVRFNGKLRGDPMVYCADFIDGIADVTQMDLLTHPETVLDSSIMP